MDYAERFALFVQAITLPLTDETHRHCQEQIEEFVAAQLAGLPYRAQFAEVVLHLDRCVACAEEYELRYELALAEAQATLPEPARWLQPELSFLMPVAQSSLLEQLRDAVQQVGKWTSLQLSAALLPALRPAYALSAVRGAEAEQRYGELLLQLQPDATMQTAWPVTLAAYRDTQQPTCCLVEVTVEPADLTWPALEGIAVTLTLGGKARTATTDPWGLVSFADVPVVALGEMNVAVEL